METAPLKVLLLGWDAPAAPTAMPPPALLQALAPRAELTLLLPRLPEPLPLSDLIQMTGLGNLTAGELALSDLRAEADLAQTWQWPAAPYLGATPTGIPVAPYTGRTHNATPTAATSPAAAPPPAAAPDRPENGSVEASEAAALVSGATEPQLRRPEFTDEETVLPTAETLNRGQPAAEVAPVGAGPAGSAARPAGRNSVLDVALAAMQALPTDEASLNFRVIQYARLATRLAASQDFAVIYASDWQSWLAGMEIRQLTGKPLVLHVYSLAQERNTPADRGWVMELERIALRRASLVLTATADLARRVIELYELAPQRVRRLDSAPNPNPDQLAETILSALREVS